MSRPRAFDDWTAADSTRLINRIREVLGLAPLPNGRGERGREPSETGVYAYVTAAAWRDGHHIAEHGGKRGAWWHRG